MRAASHRRHYMLPCAFLGGTHRAFIFMSDSECKITMGETDALIAGARVIPRLTESSFVNVPPTVTAQPGPSVPLIAEVSARDTGHLSRYNALVSISKTLAGHTTVAELFQVLADHLHSVVPFDTLALVLHDEKTDEMHLVVLEPADIAPPSVK